LASPRVVTVPSSTSNQMGSSPKGKRTNTLVLLLTPRVVNVLSDSSRYIYSKDDPNFVEFSNEGAWTNVEYGSLNDDDMEELEFGSNAPTGTNKQARKKA